jgi:hypothetical protein
LSTPEDGQISAIHGWRQLAQGVAALQALVNSSQRIQLALQRGQAEASTARFNGSVLRVDLCGYDCGGNEKSWKIDGKDAAFTRQATRVDPPVMGFDAPSTERKTQTQATAIRASLLEWAE